MASLELDEIDFEDQYDKADPIGDADLESMNLSMNLLNESIREQEELESRICRTEWSSMDKS